MIGFIGLGIMGAPMAANLVAAGHQVRAYNRSPDKARAWTDECGGEAVTSIADAVRDSDVVITVVSDSPDVEAVVLGEDGVLAHARRGTVLVDMSTVRPETARRLAAAASKVGVKVLDAPVSGGDVGAREGTLSIMVGGEAEDLETVRPVLDVLGAAVTHVGPHGAGQTVKAANQILVGGHLALLAEAVVLLEAFGVDVEAALTALGGGMAGSTVLARKGAAMREREFAPGFTAKLHHKDMQIAHAAAREAGVVTPTAAVVSELMASLVARGDGGLDGSALVALTAALSGRS